MRLNRYIARSGLSSRRGADRLIFDGKIEVNNEIMEDPAYRVAQGDIVKYKGEVIQPVEKMVYFLLNKPRGVVTTVSDPFYEETIVDFIKTSKRIFPVGRLDKESEGLILLTNDGSLTNKMTHPKYGLGKVYEVVVKGEPSENQILELEKGIVIDNYELEEMKIQRLSGNQYETTYHVTLYEGRNRQIRKVFYSVGHPVVHLKRIKIGKITAPELKVGEYRPLTAEEIEYLKKF